MAFTVIAYSYWVGFMTRFNTKTMLIIDNDYSYHLTAVELV